MFRTTAHTQTNVDSPRSFIASSEATFSLYRPERLIAAGDQHVLAQNLHLRLNLCVELESTTILEYDAQNSYERAGFAAVSSR